MSGFDALDILFVAWAFFFQIVLVVHFAVRKRFFETYTERFGWVVYALSIPATVIGVVLLPGRK
jgi:Gpi18-like mannosyltransferase